MSSPDLVLNGYPLLIRHKGVGAYTIRLIRGLLRHVPELAVRVIIPESLVHAVSDLPEHLLEVIPGTPPIRRAIAQDVYWSNRIGCWAASHYPHATFHSPAEFSSVRRPRRTVVTLHDCIYRWFPKLQGGKVRAWWWRATERYARKVSLVLTDSNCSRSDLIRFAGISADKCRVLYPWIDRDDFCARAVAGRDEARRSLSLPDRFLLYFGGFNVNKNVEFLIQAYAVASRKASLPPLVVAGYISEDLRLAVCDVRGAIRAGEFRPNQVITPGFVAEEMIPGLMAAADVLVYPSRYEGFGYPPVEAMAAGTAVLVADATSLREVVQKRECRFSLSDPAELVAKLLQAAPDPSCYRCELPAEFTEKTGVGRYLDLLGVNCAPSVSPESPHRSPAITQLL